MAFGNKFAANMALASLLNERRRQDALRRQQQLQMIQQAGAAASQIPDLTMRIGEGDRAERITKINEAVEGRRAGDWAREKLIERGREIAIANALAPKDKKPAKVKEGAEVKSGFEVEGGQDFRASSTGQPGSSGPEPGDEIDQELFRNADQIDDRDFLAPEEDGRTPGSDGSFVGESPTEAVMMGYSSALEPEYVPPELRSEEDLAAAIMKGWEARGMKGDRDLAVVLAKDTIGVLRDRAKKEYEWKLNDIRNRKSQLIKEERAAIQNEADRQAWRSKELEIRNSLPENLSNAYSEMDRMLSAWSRNKSREGLPERDRLWYEAFDKLKDKIGAKDDDEVRRAAAVRFAYWAERAKSGKVGRPVKYIRDNLLNAPEAILISGAVVGDKQKRYKMTDKSAEALRFSSRLVNELAQLSILVQHAIQTNSLDTGAARHMFLEYAKKIGVDPNQYEGTVRQRLSLLLNDYIKHMSGLAVTDNERKILEASMFSPDMDEDSMLQGLAEALRKAQLDFKSHYNTEIARSTLLPGLNPDWDKLAALPENAYQGRLQNNGAEIRLKRGEVVMGYIYETEDRNSENFMKAIDVKFLPEDLNSEAFRDFKKMVESNRAGYYDVLGREGG